MDDVQRISIRSGDELGARQALMIETGHEGQVELSEQDIRERAYQLHLARGGQWGLKEEDWLNAEAELLKEILTAKEAQDLPDQEVEDTITQ